VSAADGPVGDAEADSLFADLAAEPALILAISGGPDSTALLYLVARWRAWQQPVPRLVAVTIDHGLRPEAGHEAAVVKRFSEKLGVEHRTMRWSGAKPSTGIQEAARLARYRLLRTAARRVKACRILTAHTLDDQAETVLFRMARGSGLAGICGMARTVPIDGLIAGFRRPVDAVRSARDAAGRNTGRRTMGSSDRVNEVLLVRPLLDLPKARLIVTLQEAGIAYADDPSNVDPRFTRSRIRKLMPVLAGEGLTPHRLVRLAHRVRRSEAAHEAVVNWAARRLGLGADIRKVALDSADWSKIPAEIALRLLGRAIGTIGNEGPVEFGKLEALSDALGAALAGGTPRFCRTLAGAMVSLQENCIVIEQAPARRFRPRDKDLRCKEAPECPNNKTGA
jgi:tRNA(Ile)-lysidine synthase